MYAQWAIHAVHKALASIYTHFCHVFPFGIILNAKGRERKKEHIQTQAQNRAEKSFALKSRLTGFPYSSKTGHPHPSISTKSFEFKIP